MVFELVARRCDGRFPYVSWRHGGVGTFTSGLSGKGGLSHFKSEMPEGEFALGLSDAGEGRFATADGSVVIPATGDDVLDLRNEQVGHTVRVYDAGGKAWNATGLSNPNYALPSEATAKFTIAKAKLTVTAKDKKIEQGDAPANAGVTYKGFVGSDKAGRRLLYNARMCVVAPTTRTARWMF